MNDIFKKGVCEVSKNVQEKKQGEVVGMDGLQD